MGHNCHPKPPVKGYAGADPAFESGGAYFNKYLKWNISVDVIVLDASHLDFEAALLKPVNQKTPPGSALKVMYH
ncbi:hypothetical protein YQE_11943, partial [Dendroctonus ponderosae]